MSDKIHELLNRNLQEVFGDGDAATAHDAPTLAADPPESTLNRFMSVIIQFVAAAATSGR